MSFLIDKIKKIIPGIKINIKGNTPGDQKIVCSDSKKLKQKLKIKTFTSLNNGLKIFKKSVI